MHIDQQSGTITLPNGASISSALTQNEFRTTPEFAHAQSHDCGTLPWIHYQFGGGQIAGKDLLARVCFYDQLLVDVTLAVDHYPPGPRDWSHYSLEIESETKHFHDR